MEKLSKLYNKYITIEKYDFRESEINQLSNDLINISESEIQSKENAEKYISLLKIFREYIIRNDRHHGKNYLLSRKNNYSVGEDGLYSDRLRFIYELIQNVDDCDYTNVEDPELSIRFDINHGRIILTYNEDGFRPFHVFAITGIAEESKNITVDKTEIGEKGIGFKSVFGVAKSVLIQSGYFSFRIDSDNFTIPIPCYNNFSYKSGTVMTLELYDKTDAETIYKKLEKQYSQKSALFNQNPIMFLNKLTQLKIHVDTKRSIEFNITRSNTDTIKEFFVEENVDICLKIKNIINNCPKNKEYKLSCYRYTYPITYPENVYKERYQNNSENISSTGKRMFLYAITPKEIDITKSIEGQLYSFLPTQIKLSIPFAVHVPFKLGESREFVDPQKYNQWFTTSCKALDSMMKLIYKDLSIQIKNNIVYYLPKKFNSIFKNTNEKINCLINQDFFDGKKYLENDIFYSENKKYYSAEEIIFINLPNSSDMVTVYNFLDCKKHLFIPPKGIDMTDFGVEKQNNIDKILFSIAMKNPKKTKEILNFFNESENFLIHSDYIKSMGEFILTEEQIQDIICFPKTAKLFNIYAIEAIKNNSLPNFSIDYTQSVSLKNCLYNDFQASDTNPETELYLERIKLRCSILNNIKQNSFFIANNIIFLTGENIKESFCDFCYNVDRKDAFAARMKIQIESEKLNQLDSDTSVSASEYLKKLRGVRQSVKSALGDSAYSEYIKLVLNAGKDPGRFLNEILQNADDCKYPENETPTFDLIINDNKIDTYYNEIGFNKSQIRTITAIGESTKKKLLSGEKDVIGEKGVGFKTVFGVASKVIINSGAFHFSLSDNMPTIPTTENTKTTTKGTHMCFYIKDKKHINLTETKVLMLCLCLRNLRHLNLDKYEIDIKDSKTQRIITINKNQYIFMKTCYKISEEKLINSKYNKSSDHNKNIYCYGLRNHSKQNFSDFRVYSGMPTEIKINVPLSIDVPLELTTSRDIAIENSYNKNLIPEIYNAIIDFMLKNKKELRIKILDYINIETEQIHGRIISKRTNMFSESMFNSIPFAYRLRNIKFLPTYAPNIFLAPEDKGRKIPHFLDILINKEKQISIPREKILSIQDSEKYNSILKTLNCYSENHSEIISIIQRYANDYINDYSFRTSLYSYLKNLPNPKQYSSVLCSINIIPVFDINKDDTIYLSWIPDKIFTEKGKYASTSNYYVLNEKILSRLDCENILNVKINEMDSKYRSSRYRDDLDTYVTKYYKTDPLKLYNLLLQEFKLEHIQNNNALGNLLVAKSLNKIPLKNAYGELISYSAEIFINSNPQGYFSPMIDKLSCHKECLELAKYLNYERLNHLTYDKIPSRLKIQLTANDIESFQDDYFINGRHILSDFLNNNLISYELCNEYGLDFMTDGNICDKTTYSFPFPSEKVENIRKLCEHINKRMDNPGKIVAVEEVRSVHKVFYNGQYSSIDSASIRQNTMKRYLCDNTNLCFCQMCKEIKNCDYIEVNNLEKNPKYYFPELRVSLCLECSKWFEKFRNSDHYYNKFLDDLQKADYTQSTPVEIPIDNRTITFTQKHLAEIQQILKGKDKLK